MENGNAVARGKFGTHLFLDSKSFSQGINNIAIKRVLASSKFHFSSEEKELLNSFLKNPNDKEIEQKVGILLDQNRRLIDSGQANAQVFGRGRSVYADGITYITFSEFSGKHNPLLLYAGIPYYNPKSSGDFGSKRHEEEWKKALKFQGKLSPEAMSLCFLLSQNKDFSDYIEEIEKNPKNIPEFDKIAENLIKFPILEHLLKSEDNTVWKSIIPFMQDEKKMYICDELYNKYGKFKNEWLDRINSYPDYILDLAHQYNNIQIIENYHIIINNKELQKELRIRANVDINKEPRGENIHLLPFLLHPDLSEKQNLVAGLTVKKIQLEAWKEVGLINPDSIKQDLNLNNNAIYKKQITLSLDNLATDSKEKVYNDNERVLSREQNKIVSAFLKACTLNDKFARVFKIPYFDDPIEEDREYIRSNNYIKDLMEKNIERIQHSLSQSKNPEDFLKNLDESITKEMFAYPKDSKDVINQGIQIVLSELGRTRTVG